MNAANYNQPDDAQDPQRDPLPSKSGLGCSVRPSDRRSSGYASQAPQGWGPAGRELRPTHLGEGPGEPQEEPGAPEELNPYVPSESEYERECCEAAVVNGTLTKRIILGLVMTSLSYALMLGILHGLKGLGWIS